MKTFAAIALLASTLMQSALCTTIKISYKTSLVTESDMHSLSTESASRFKAEAASFKSKCYNDFVDIVLVGEITNSDLTRDEILESSKSTLAVAQLLVVAGFSERWIFQYQINKAKAESRGIARKTTNEGQHQIEVEMVCTPGPNRSKQP